MCGFAGFYLFRNNVTLDKRSVLKSMGAQIEHRGPDDEQTFIGDELSLIFKRLSIVDIDGGRQPLTNEDQSIILVVNGEIYNYKELIKNLKGKHNFATASDCEVLVHLYEEKGPEFLKDINGMFALALWDKKRKQLLLARDRFGVKPLYYSLNRDRFLFGSEIKSLLPFPDCPAEYNWFQSLGIKGAIADHYEIETCFQGINQVKGGEYIVVKSGDPQIYKENYWSIIDCLHNQSLMDDASPDQIIGGYAELLADSVNLMLMGDVDVGLFLSGGIDSSAIAAFAAKHSDIKTFSVFNDDTIESQDAIFARKVANSLGLSNHQVKVLYDTKFHSAEFWKDLVWQCETFECGTEQLFKFELYRFIKSNFPKLKIVLLGQGSDEFNGGYAHKYINESKPEKINRWKDFEHACFQMEQSFLFSGINQHFTHYQQFINRDYVASLKESSITASPWYGYLNMHSKNLQLYQLLHEDRTAMANSIENRVPFLDHRLVEYVLRIPPKYFSQLFWNKNILREGMKKSLKPIFCNRPKVPFIFDNKTHYSRKIILDIFTNNGNELVNYALGEPDTKHDILNRRAIENLFSSVKSDPNYRGIDELRFLVNMGILSKKINERSFVPKIDWGNLGLNQIGLSNKNANETAVFNKAFNKSEIKLSEIAKKTRLILSENIDFLTDTEGAWYVFLDGNIAEMIDEKIKSGMSWINVLRHAKKHNNDITKSIIQFGQSEEDLRKQISKSLKSKVITRIDD